MKKSVFILAILFFSSMAIAQKKENGTLYIEHPAIKVVNEFVKVTVAGDSSRIASFLTPGFRSFNGTSSGYRDTGMNKADFVNNALIYFRRLDYFNIETSPGSYPDALLYTKDNKEEGMVVQSWDELKGVDKITGVKIDAGLFRIYYVTKDGKISRIINYANGKVIDEIMASFVTRTNGKIYNHHENINTVRKMVYALEHGDVDKCLSFYSDNAQFSNLDEEWGQSHSKSVERASIQNFLNAFEIKSIEMVGYPDYLEYEMGNGRSVLSWWKFNLVRKKDKKVIVLPMHVNDEFDVNGKIVSEISYYNSSFLTK